MSRLSRGTKRRYCKGEGASSSYNPRVFARVYCVLTPLVLAMHQYTGERVCQDHRVARKLTTGTSESRGRTERTGRGRTVITSAEERGP
jgi:hypothetical protein